MDRDLIEIFEDNYFIGTNEDDVNKDKKYFVLIIYDISNNRRRNRMVKVLESFGVRVQKSAFEAILRPNKYRKLINSIKNIPEETDSVRVYKIQGQGTVENFGEYFTLEEEETIII